MNATSSKRSVLVVGVLCLLFIQHAWAYGLFTVGGDSACGYQNLQDAINAATDPEGNTVFVTRSMDYEGQHVQIFGGNIAILGGLDDCSSQTYSGQTRVAGGDDHSVFEIEDDANIYIANLYVTGGNMGAGNKGGGIYFGGAGSLELANVTVGANTSGYGGGIDMSPGSGPATLTLDADVYVIANTALVSGGGIRIEGDTRLYALKPDTWIASNEAQTGYGGGVEIVGPARADFSGSGPGGGSIIDSNTAQYGGGVDVIGTDSGSAVLRLFTTDPANPVQVSNNVAYNTGGAIYLKPYNGLFGSSGATVCAYDFRIASNTAQEGAAIYADLDSSVGDPFGSSVYANDAEGGDDLTCVQPESVSALGAVPCATGVACNRIEHSTAQQPDGTPTDGSTILLQTSSHFAADRIDVRDNTGTHVIRAVGDAGDVEHQTRVLLSDCSLVHNTVTQELAAATDGDGGLISFDACTIAHNSIGGSVVIRVPGGAIGLRRSIVDQTGALTVDPPLADTGNARYVLTNDDSTLPDSNTIEVGTPTFVDADSGDFHLAPDSIGVDFATIDESVRTYDLDHLTRVVDLPAENVFGAVDLGAYEVQIDEVLGCAVADSVFCNGFE